MCSLADPELVGPEAPTVCGVIFNLRDVFYFGKFYKTRGHVNTVAGPLPST